MEPTTTKDMIVFFKNRTNLQEFLGKQNSYLPYGFTCNGHACQLKKIQGYNLRRIYLPESEG
jgi:hypothetical protein